MLVSGPMRDARHGAIAVKLCAFSVNSTTSTGPTAVGSSVAIGRASNSPISPRTRTPRSCIARRCAPRAINATSSPALLSIAPTKAPIAPAPTTANFMVTILAISSRSNCWRWFFFVQPRSNDGPNCVHNQPQRGPLHHQIERHPKHQAQYYAGVNEDKEPSHQSGADRRLHTATESRPDCRVEIDNGDAQNEGQHHRFDNEIIAWLRHVESGKFRVHGISQQDAVDHKIADANYEARY